MAPSVSEEVLRRDNYQCRGCGHPAEQIVHYLVPPNAGGAEAPVNMVALCRRCQQFIAPESVDYLLETMDISMERYLVRRAHILVAVYASVIEDLETGRPIWWRFRERSRRRARQRRKSKRHSRRASMALAKQIPEWKEARPRAGKKWESEEDEWLLQEFDAGLPLDEIAGNRGRGVRSVEVRLFKLGRGHQLPLDSS